MLSPADAVTVHKQSVWSDIILASLGQSSALRVTWRTRVHDAINPASLGGQASWPELARVMPVVRMYDVKVRPSATYGSCVWATRFHMVLMVQPDSSVCRNELEKRHLDFIRS